jgi:HD-GYP domain-containing protein (c-di-GMP phosphodiesterase class II)
MRLVSSRHLQAGTVVARDVRPGVSGTAPLVLRGTSLTASMCRRLIQLGIAAVWVDDELGVGIEPLEALSEETRAAAERAVATTLTQARKALVAGQQLEVGDLRRLRDAAAEIAYEIASLPEAVYALSEMRNAHAYTHEHSVRVTTLGLLLAARHWKRRGWIDHRGRQRFDGLQQRMTQLGLGLLVHDIGKLAIPHEVLDKPGRLDAQEWELVRRHPELGAAMLSHTTTSMLAIAVVRFHHERWDGAGYPRALAGRRISELARIAAVADVYDAVRSERPYKPAQPPHVGVEVVVNGAGTAFDPAIVETFGEVVMPFPAGHEIDLPDGRWGVVVSVEPERPYRPRVRICEADGAVREEQGDLTPAAAAPRGREAEAPASR